MKHPALIPARIFDTDALNKFRSVDHKSKNTSRPVERYLESQWIDSTLSNESNPRSLKKSLSPNGRFYVTVRGKQAPVVYDLLHTKKL